MMARQAVVDRTTAGDVLRSLAFYAAFYGGSVLFVLVAMVLLPLSKRGFRNAVEGWSHWHRLCVRALLRITVRVEGNNPTGKVLLAVKHESFFEAIDLPGLLNYPGVFAKAELLRIPLWGYAGARYGLIGVEREAGARALRAMLASARALSEQGRPLAIFPEGTRVAHGARAPLQSGFAGLYKLIGLPVIPVAVDSGPLYHRRWKCKGTITVRFGDPIPVGLARAEVEARVLEAINALNPEVSE
jgi:1-acyl-sn-glycerol-3-phosphate acyltransferase